MLAFFSREYVWLYLFCDSRCAQCCSVQDLKLGVLSMSVSPPPAKRGADICDAKAFLKGLRSISLRNLSVM